MPQPIAKEAPSTAELKAEYERAVASLTEEPILEFHPWMFFILIAQQECRARVFLSNEKVADCLVRVAGIALAGAAWMRRAK